MMNRRYGNRLTLWILILISCIGVLPAMTDEKEEKGWEVILCNPLMRSIEMDSAWDVAKAVGVKGIEIHVDLDLGCSRLWVGDETPYRFDTRENAVKIRKDAEANGLIVPVLCAPLGIAPDTGDEKILAAGKTLIENAPSAGVELIYFPIVTDNFTQPTFADGAFAERASAVLKELCVHGKKHGITVTFENLSVYWNRPEITKRVLANCSDEGLGICLDPINFYWYGHPRSKIYEIVKELMPKAKHFHMKNVTHPEEKREVQRPVGWNYGKHSVPAPDGDLDFKEMLEWLAKTDYNGYISIEDDSLGHYDADRRVDVLRHDVLHARSIIDALNSR